MTTNISINVKLVVLWLLSGRSVLARRSTFRGPYGGVAIMSPARPHHPVIMNRLLAEHWHRRKEVRSIVLVVVCLMYTTFVHIRPAQINVNHYRHTGTIILRSQNSSKIRFVVADSAWALSPLQPSAGRLSLRYKMDQIFLFIM